MNTVKRFKLRNVSIPADMSLKGMSDEELRADIRSRIGAADVVLAFTSVAASHSDWIKVELEIAKELGKPVVAISPLKSSRKSQYVLSMSTRHVQPWRVDSVVNAIREAKSTARRPAQRPTDKAAPEMAPTLWSVKDVVGSTLRSGQERADVGNPVPTPTHSWFRKYW